MKMLSSLFLGLYCAESGQAGLGSSAVVASLKVPLETFYDICLDSDYNH
jgi:hypothetical protein